MTAPNQTSEVLHFPDYPQGPRFVRPIDPQIIAKALGEDHYGQDGPAQQPWPYADYGDIPPGVALVERIGEALGSDNAFRCYVSFIAGSFFTLGMAYLWSVVL